MSRNQFPPGVKPRLFGSDHSFLYALRHHPRFQNRINVETGIAVTDCDIIACNYKHEGVKELYCVQVVELKSRNAEPDFAQRQVLRVFNSFKGNRNGMIFYGASFVSYSGVEFMESEAYRWGRFSAFGDILWRSVDRESVFDLVTMLKHPDTLTNRKLFKSHHGVSILSMETKTQLGFSVPCIIKKRY